MNLRVGYIGGGLLVGCFWVYLVLTYVVTYVALMLREGRDRTWKWCELYSSSDSFGSC